MFFVASDMQVASGFPAKRQFLQDFRRYDPPISALGEVMEHNWFSLLDLYLALVIYKL